MKDFLKEETLRRAAQLSCAVTAMATPRLLEADLPMPFIPLVLFTFLAMTAAAGCAWAWQHRAGMAGMFPERRRIALGIVWALAAALAIGAILQATDPLLRDAILERGDESLWRATFPATAGECVSQVLWGAGVQTLFFTAAALAFFCRLINRLGPAVFFVLCLRAVVTLHRFADAGLNEVILPYVALAVVKGLIACLLYVRTGLPAAMTFSAAVDLRHFLNLEIARSFPEAGG